MPLTRTVWSLPATLFLPTIPVPPDRRTRRFEPRRRRIALTTALLGMSAAAPIKAQVQWERKTVLSPLIGHAMASDTVRNRIVLFGGSIPSGSATDETWEWTGSAWSFRPVAAGPSARTGHAMVFDSARGRTLLFGGSDASYTVSFADTWEWDGSSWIQLLPSASPPPRGEHGMAFDSARNRAVLFGGVTFPGTTYRSDTWQWDGTSWAMAVPAQSPSPRTTSMAFDTLRNRTVLFGGRFGGQVMGDTWEWDGNNWLQRTTSPSPSARWAEAFAYDPIRGRCVLLSATIGTGSGPPADTWEWDGVNWTPRGATAVMRRLHQKMAYDPVQQSALVFGGRFHDSGPRVPLAIADCSDSWTWDGTSWSQADGHTSPPRASNLMAFDAAAGRVQVVTNEGSYATTMLTWHWFGDRWRQLQPPMNPPERLHACLATDPVRQRVVLFGGLLASNYSYLDQTWEWDGLTWVLRSPPLRPPARERAAMAYHDASGLIVLFGGENQTNSVTFADTWEWNGSNWLQRNPAQSPPPSSRHGLAGDDTRGVVVLVRGNPTETWEWDGVTWSQRAPTLSPPGRSSAAMTWDPARSRIVLDGGDSPNGRLSDTWEWDGVDWLQRVPTTVPPVRSFHHISFDPDVGRLVLYGGNRAVTWEYGPTNPAGTTAFGIGCPGSASIPSLAATSLPWLGDNLVLKASNLAATATFVSIVVGFSDQTWGGWSLPHSLQAFGMPGCHLLVSAEAVGAMTVSGATASFSLPIPNDAGLLGVTLFHQAAVFEPGANTAGIVVSNATRSVVGGR